MSKVYEIAFQMGGQVTGAFSKTMQSANSALGDLQKQIQGVNTQASDVGRLQKLQRSVGQLSREYTQAQSTAQRLGKELAATANPTKKQQQEFERARQTAARLKGELGSKRQELHQLRGSMDATGQSTRELTARQRELTQQAERARTAQSNLQKALAAQQDNLNRRANLRGQLFDATAMALTLAAPVRAAMIEQDAQVRLRTVINSEDQEQAMATARKAARELAQSGIVGLQEGYDIQYALNSAGLEAEAATAASKVVAAVAKVTSGAPEQVGEVIATTYNNLGKQLEGTTEDQMNRIGDLLTKVQLKYQIRDFNQLGESMKYASSAMAGFNVDMEQGVAVVGALNTAGLQGSQAGTAFNAMMSKMSSATRELGADMVRSADGTLDLAATLSSVEESMRHMDIDERANELQRLFGQQGARAMIPLLQNVDQLKEDMLDVSQNSKGLVDKEVQGFLNSASGMMNKLRGRAVVLGASLGSVLLPGIVGVVGPLASAAQMAAQLAERFPLLTKVIVGGTAALIAMRIAAIAGGYAWTFVKGAWLSANVVLRKLQASMVAHNVTLRSMSTSAMLFAKTSIPAMIAGVKAFGIALMTNPIGLFVAAVTGAVVLVAGLIYKYWEPIKAFMAGFWRGFVEGVQPVLVSLKPLLDLLSPLGGIFGAIGREVSGVVKWFGSLFKQAEYSEASLKSAASAGQRFGQLLATAVNWVIAPVQSLTKIISTLSGVAVSTAKGIGTAWNWLVESAISAFAQFNPMSWISSKFNAAREWLAEFSLSGEGAAIVQGMKWAFMNLTPMGWTLKAFNAARDWLSGFDLSSITSSIVDGVKWSFMNLTPMGWALKAFNAARDWLSGFDLSSITSSIVDGVKWAFMNLTPLGWTLKAFNAASEWLSGFSLAELTSRIIAGVQQSFGSLNPVSWISSAFNSARDWLSNFSLFDSGRKIILTIGSGIRSAASSVVNSVKNVFTRVRNLLPFSDAKEGPLAELTKSGAAIMSTLAAGVNKTPQLQEAVANQFKETQSAGFGALNAASKGIHSLISLPMDTLRATADLLKNSMPAEVTQKLLGSQADQQDKPSLLNRLSSAVAGKSGSTGDTIQVTVEQTIQISGVADDAAVREQAAQGAREGTDNLMSKLEELMANKRRVSYG